MLGSKLMQSRAQSHASTVSTCATKINQRSSPSAVVCVAAPLCSGKSCESQDMPNIDLGSTSRFQALDPKCIKLRCEMLSDAVSVFCFIFLSRWPSVQGILFADAISVSVQERHLQKRTQAEIKWIELVVLRLQAEMIIVVIDFTNCIAEVLNSSKLAAHRTPPGPRSHSSKLRSCHLKAQNNHLYLLVTTGLIGRALSLPNYGFFHHDSIADVNSDQFRPVCLPYPASTFNGWVR